MDYASIYPDYQSLKLTLWISGAIISLLLVVVAYFLKKQITVSETLSIAVNHLTTMVKIIEQQQSERDPRTENRLNNHSHRLNKHDQRLTRVETKCKIHHKETEEES
jgi:hypothetical protein